MKNHPPYYLFLLFALLLSACDEDTFEPTIYGAVEGTIIEQWNDTPLEGVKVSLTSSSNSTYTDENGYYFLDEIEVGEYSVNVTKDGYSSWSESVIIDEEDTVTVDFIMETSELSNIIEQSLLLISPEAGEIDLPLSYEFHWRFLKETYRGEELNVDLYTMNIETMEEVKHAENLTDTLYTASGLAFNSPYVWYLKLYAGDIELGQTEMLRFETQTIPPDMLFYTKMVDQNYEIYAYDTLSAMDYRITNHPAKDWFPRKSPANDRIAFISNRDDANHVYTMLADGTDVKKVSNQYPVAGYHNTGVGVTWSPDGGYLLYPHNNKLIKINKEGFDAQILATAPTGKHFAQCDWSRFGHKIVAQVVGENIYESEIYIMDEDGSNMTLLVADMPGRTESPVISFDGTKVYYTHDVEGLDAWDGSQLNSKIFRINADGSNQIEMEIDKPLGSNLWYPKLLRSGVGITYASGIGNTYNRTINILFFANDGTEQETQVVIQGDMPEW